jgi:arylsulfatase A-like enzyme
MQLRQHILRGALYGLWAWLVYGIVEFVLACGVPVLFHPGVEILGWQWRLIAQLFGVYLLFGLIVGSAGGALLNWTGSRRENRFGIDHEIIAVLTIAVAFVVNRLAAPPRLVLSDYIALAIAIMLAAAFVGALRSRVWLERTSFLVNPFAISSLLLIVPWVNRTALINRSRIEKIGVSVLACGVIVVAAVSYHRLRSGRTGTVQRRAVIASAAILVLAAVLVSGMPPTIHATQAGQPTASSQCNVVLITMDTVRADHLSVYGYERDTTPHLQDFARTATLYRRAVAAADMTLPAHASIFTGLYPAWHGADIAPPRYPLGRPLAPRYVTLAQVLRSKGYWTAAVVANYAYLQPSLGMASGFAVFDSPLPVHMSTSKEPFFLREGSWRVLSLIADTAAVDVASLHAADIDRRASTLLEQARHGRSFFLFLNYMDAHDPDVSEPPFNRRFPGRDPYFKTSGYEEIKWAVNSGKRQIGTREKSHLLSQYDGGIAYIDDEVGLLLARLREMGLYDNTLIIITADHGEAFGEHDVMQHGMGSVYQDQVYVPLLIKYPGQHEPRESDALASQVDLMPTILDVAGISPPSGIQGRTLRLPPPEDTYAVYSQALAITYLRLVSRRFRGVRRAIFSGSLKLITWTEGPSELYDLAADPGETHNLYCTDDPRARALEHQLSTWVAAAPRQFEQPGELDKNSVERLKSLGYAQ